jgi:RNA polymerase sigma factor (sigma-70 family)
MNQASVATLDTPPDQQLIGAAQDQRLVSAARDGDDRAFEQLYERYRPRIRAFALRMTRDPDRAEDLVQEVFISAFRRLRETDAPIVFRPWIYEIARNACIDEHRRRRRVTEVPIDGDRTDGWLEHLASGASPEVAIESKQQLEDLCGAFRGLSERHHRIIVARELEGKSYRQIGDELGMSQVVVESTLFRARRRLTEEFQDLSTGRRCARVQRTIATAAGRRLGVRERRALRTHIEHCRPCRREALAAGLSLETRPMRPLQKVAAGLLPVPLFRLLRRAGAAIHRRLLGSSAAAARIGQSMASMGSGRMAAAVAVLAAGVGGGLLAQPGRAPAQPASEHAAAPPLTAGHLAATGDRLASRPIIASHSGRRAVAASGAKRPAGRLASRASAVDSTNAPDTTLPSIRLPGLGNPAPIQASTPSPTSVIPRTAGSVTGTLATAQAPVKPSLNLSAGGSSAAALARGTQSVGSLPVQSPSSLQRTTSHTAAQLASTVP